jgi:hypothetical protein
MHRVALAAVTALTLAACGPGGVHNGDDGGADATDPQEGGLVFRFVAPDIGQTTSDLTVSQLRLSLRDVRALGDAAPGDERTTLDRRELELHDQEMPEIRFDQAPPGRYSSFEFEIDRALDGESSWSMEGVVHFDDADWSFSVEDEESRAISLPLQDVTLAAGETATITVEIDVIAICSDVDWPSLPREGSEIQIDDDSSAIAGMRANLVTSFSIAGVDVQ